MEFQFKGLLVLNASQKRPAHSWPPAFRADLNW
jgi:hypothetical protein